MDLGPPIREKVECKGTLPIVPVQTPRLYAESLSAQGVEVAAVAVAAVVPRATERESQGIPDNHK
jgi:hypothetical protein